MLNAKALTELLSENSDDKLCRRWFLMTLNGTLLAYTQPTNSKDLRKQAAMAALSWQEHQNLPKLNPSEATRDRGKPTTSGPLHTLTVESESSNMIIRKVHPQLLLVLEGGVPPRKRTFEHRISSEGPDDAPYPAQDENADPALSTSVTSATDSVRSTAAASILALQRRKLDAMASAISQDFERTGFKMPEEGNVKFF